MNEVKGYRSFVRIDKIDKGWSADRKYYIETDDGKHLLLRIADISEYSRKKTEFEIMQKLAKLDIPVSLPVAFGVCEDNKSVYTLYTWCDGEDAENYIGKMSDTEQYMLGISSGRLLKMIHSLPAPKEQEEWAVRFNRKIDVKIRKYRECGLRFTGDEKVIKYIEDNRYLICGRPSCLQHGDYHVGNMIISDDMSLSVIDFNRYDYGDPWEEFNRIVWSAKASPYFATGKLDGYFDGEPPSEFFKLLLLYIACNTLSSIYWAIPFGQTEIDTMMKQTQDILLWFDDMNSSVPSWYQKDTYIQYIDGIAMRLERPFDLSIINKLGKVFKVFDDQDSGNLCFGIQDKDVRYFIKFAGAPTVIASVTPDEAVKRLKEAVVVYKKLYHHNLIRLIDTFETKGGFGACFEWSDGECMGRMYPKSRQKFLGLSLLTKLSIFDDILTFHEFVNKEGYAAVDFYDGSILYDFKLDKTLVCDIDFYKKMPFVNDMGRMWGSSRFMAPEEFLLGAVIDEVTNVYTMGATAFALFGDYIRTDECWQLDETLYQIAKKAVSHDRTKRQQSIRELIKEWEAARDDFEKGVSKSVTNG